VEYCYAVRPVASPYSRGVLNAGRSQHPERLRPDTRPWAVFGEDLGGGRQENCCNSNERNWNKSTNYHCFLWTIRDSWRTEWITASRFVNFWKLGGGGLQNPQDPLDTGLVYTYASRLPRLVIANAVDFDHERGHGPSDWAQKPKKASCQVVSMNTMNTGPGNKYPGWCLQTALSMQRTTSVIWSMWSSYSAWRVR